jgi:hypothetical protein
MGLVRAAGGRGNAERAVRTRVTGVGGGTLDLLAARFRRHRYAPHIHHEFAVGVCLAGAEEIRYRGTLHRAGPGTIVVLEPGEAHTGGPAIADGYAYRVLYPPVELFGDTESGKLHFPDPISEDPGLADRLSRLHRGLTGRHDPLEAETRLLTLPAYRASSRPLGSTRRTSPTRIPRRHRSARRGSARPPAPVADSPACGTGAGSASESTLVVHLGDSVRIQFQFQNDPP